MTPLAIALIVIGIVLFIVLALLLTCYISSDRFPAIPLRDAKVVITGGSEGLGLCLSQMLVQRGAHLVVISRSQDKLKKALEILEKEAIHDVRLLEALQIFDLKFYALPWS